jgi:hypothetical protein
MVCAEGAVAIAASSSVSHCGALAGCANGRAQQTDSDVVSANGRTGRDLIELEELVRLRLLIPHGNFGFGRELADVLEA